MGIAQHSTTSATTGPAPTTGPTMQAIVQHAYGTADVLQFGRAPRPEIADGEVLLKVRAAGLDRGTWHFMTGTPYLMRVIGFGFRRPKNQVVGLDVAGTVVAVGSAVTRFAIGDEVFGIAKGSFAEYAAAREDKLAHKPANCTAEQAAVAGVSALTALQAVRDSGRVRPGQRVLITGASGGVGSYAVQIAKGYGAEVTAVCSAGKFDLVRSLGADHVIDYATADFADGTQQYDVIIDIAGNSSLRRLRRALTPTGTAAIVGGEQRGNLTGGFERTLRALLLTPFIGQRLAGVVNKERGSDLEVIAGLIRAGTVTPTIDRRYPLAQARQAMEHLVAGRARGKVAITI
jgi:NADPH:quinone reductase-like Zn-dependent oxidoreductase